MYTAHAFTLCIYVSLFGMHMAYTFFKMYINVHVRGYGNAGASAAPVRSLQVTGPIDPATSTVFVGQNMADICFSLLSFPPM